MTSFLPPPVEVSPSCVESISRASQGISVTVDPLHWCVVAGNRNLAMALAFEVITSRARCYGHTSTLENSSLALLWMVDTKSGQVIRLGKLLTLHGDVPEEVSLWPWWSHNRNNIGNKHRQYSGMPQWEEKCYQGMLLDGLPACKIITMIEGLMEKFNTTPGDLLYPSESSEFLKNELLQVNLKGYVTTLLRTLSLRGKAISQIYWK